jgi:hypothetical protein
MVNYKEIDRLTADALWKIQCGLVATGEEQLRKAIEARPPQRNYLNLLYNFAVNTRNFALAEYLDAWGSDKIGAPPPYFRINPLRTAAREAAYGKISESSARGEPLTFRGRPWKPLAALQVKVDKHGIHRYTFAGRRSISWGEITRCTIEVSPQVEDIGGSKEWRYESRVMRIESGTKAVAIDVTPGYFGASAIADPDVFEDAVRTRVAVDEITTEHRDATHTAYVMLVALILVLLALIIAVRLG